MDIFKLLYALFGFKMKKCKVFLFINKSKIVKK